MTIEIVDFPIVQMVDLSSSFFVRVILSEVDFPKLPEQFTGLPLLAMLLRR
jgi:hypothetical protein